MGGTPEGGQVASGPDGHGGQMDMGAKQTWGPSSMEAKQKCVPLGQKGRWEAIRCCAPSWCAPSCCKKRCWWNDEETATTMQCAKWAAARTCSLIKHTGSVYMMASCLKRRKEGVAMQHTCAVNATEKRRITPDTTDTVS